MRQRAGAAGGSTAVAAAARACATTVAATLATALALGAAPGASRAAETLPLGTQSSHAQCPLAGREARAWVVDEPARWSAAMPIEQALGRGVHWGQEMLLVVALEQQPTLGVRVTLDERFERRWGGRLELRARVQRPAAGEMAQTALSRPCVLAALPKVRWRRVMVRLESRRLMAERAPPSVSATASEGRMVETLPRLLPPPASTPR